ncbi:ArsR/SmtB family transcription factor [Salsuginibacillus kocurii]|uniref:ArsR/SmtB family transcription factor n=1 Tax=Salsuginibacillus kocurii TaxID=427078 RepID=UPI00035FA810|nr:metalloregulator ArsR/SmtB family transcription factor [Salsuginibacillus kocurii]
MELEINQQSSANSPNEQTFERYATQFKALSDARRLKLMHELTLKGEVCVCDLSSIMDLPQSKLSYHLKLLMDAELITRTKHGTWHYYQLNEETVNHLLSPELCCLFRPSR